MKIDLFKTTTAVVYLALTCMVIGVILVAIKAFEPNKTEPTVTAFEPQNEIVERYVKDSITHTIYKEKIISNGVAEKEVAIGKTYADSLRRALKISLDKIDQVTKINASLEAKLALSEQPPDNGKRKLSHRDQHLRLDYYPDTDSVDLAMNIGLNEARYKKRKWLFGKTENYIQVFPDDDRIKINGLKSFTVKESTPKRLGIGVNAGYGLYVDSNGMLRQSPTVSLGLNYNFIEF